jgi:hypothetical protein
MAFDDDLDYVSILVPVDVVNTAGVLTSITAGGVTLAEDTNSAWASGTTYTIGQRVHSVTTHRVYESLKDGNLGKDPTLAANRTTAAGVGTWWLDIGPTNRVAMFDGLVNTQTSATSPLVITLSPGAFNGFALFGVDADSFAVTVRDAPGGNIIYSEQTTALEGSMPADYYEYFFDRFKPLTQLIRTKIDPYGTAQITLTLTKATGPVKLGMFAIGDMRPVGVPQRDAVAEPIDYSYVKTDAYGNTEVKKRVNATGLSITAKMDKEDANTALNAIKQVLGTPCVVVGSEQPLYEWLTVFGLVSGRMSAADYPYVELNITVKGLI